MGSHTDADELMTATEMVDTPTVLASLSDEVRGLRDDFDKVLPHLVDALNRDRAYDKLSERLESAERRLESGWLHPIVREVVGFLHRMRRTQLDSSIAQVLESELLRILSTFGYEEYGAVGDAYDPELHQPLARSGGEDLHELVEVHNTGFRYGEQVVLKAEATIGRLKEDA